MITTDSPGRTRAAFNAAPAPVMTAQPMMEVTSVATPVSSGTTICWSATVSRDQVNVPVNAGAPKLIVWPRYVTWAGVGRGVLRVALRCTQVTMTWSPSLTWLTSLPTPVTTPLDSCPSTSGSVGFGRLSSCNCEWHTPVAKCRTLTCVGPGFGRSMSSMTMGLPDSTKMAAGVFIQSGTSLLLTSRRYRASGPEPSQDLWRRHHPGRRQLCPQRRRTPGPDRAQWRRQVNLAALPGRPGAPGPRHDHPQTDQRRDRVPATGLRCW